MTSKLLCECQLIININEGVGLVVIIPSLARYAMALHTSSERAECRWRILDNNLGRSSGDVTAKSPEMANE